MVGHPQRHAVRVVQGLQGDRGGHAAFLLPPLSIHAEQLALLMSRDLHAVFLHLAEL